jgi:hypothetical protein
MSSPLYLPTEEAVEAIREATGWKTRRTLITDGCARGFCAVASWYEEIGDTEMASLLRLDLLRFHRR